MKDKDKINSYTLSCIWIIMCGYIFIAFIKEFILQKYLIHMYVDSFVGICAFYIVIHHLKKQWELTHHHKSLIIELLTLIIALIIAVIGAHQPFDISYLILVVGMITSKKVLEKVYQNR